MGSSGRKKPRRPDPAGEATSLELQSRQRRRKVDLRQLRRIVAGAIEALPADAGKTAKEATHRVDELSICLVGAREMARVNQDCLGHEGSTDVITFDYSDGSGIRLPRHGEILVCVDEAILQGARFGTDWRSELVRYIVHGLLHLRGFDDKRARPRRRMKREENRLVRLLARGFDFDRLGSPG